MRVMLRVGSHADEYARDLVEGARLVAARHPVAAWDEPASVLVHLAYVDDVGALRRAAAHLSAGGQVPVDDGSLFHDEVVARIWARGPEHRIGHGVPRVGAYDHFLHHTGEPLVYSPADFAPVVVDLAAPGGLVTSAPRLLAEAEHLAGVLGWTPALTAVAEAARASIRSGAALVTAYV